MGRLFHSLPVPHYRPCHVLQNASILLVYGFIVLPVVVAVGLSAIVWRAVGAAGYGARHTNRLQIGFALAAVAWLALTLWVSATGVLRQFDRRPPPIMLLVATLVAVAAWARVLRDRHPRRASHVVGGAGRAAGVQAAVGTADAPGLRGRRHARADELFRPQLRHRHWNHRRGARVGARARPVPRWIIAAWNLLGTLLLLNILEIAVASMPMFRYGSAPTG